jgi:2-dehydropantoate 2-reductase
MRWKYRKLLSNLANAVEAASGRLGENEAARELVRRAREEGSLVLRAAGIDVASAEEDAAHRGDRVVPGPVAGSSRGGGSSWQSLARGTGAIEADYLNGEIVLLGRLHRIPTPVNALLQRTANRLAHERRPPGSVAAEALLAEATRALHPAQLTNPVA